MKKITFFLHCLIAGGVQKSVSTLANHLSDKYLVNIILADDTQEIYYEIDKNIHIDKIKTKKIDVNNKEVGDDIFQYRVDELNKLLSLNKPDLVVSYEDYHNLILLSTQYKCKKIISCRNIIEEKYTKDSNIHLYSGDSHINGIKNLYSKADLIICVSKYIENELRKFITSNNIITIYNGIESKNHPIQNINIDKKFILNISRLAKHKGQIDLIKAFEIIHKNIEHDLIILGDGAIKEELKNLIDELNLSDRVHLLGTKNPYLYIAKCDLFVFPSYYEGFSNTILEVMSMKKPIVAYDYLGSNEILNNDIIVNRNDINALSKKMLQFINNKDLSNDIANKLFEKSKEFSLEKSLQKYVKNIEYILQ